MRQNYLPPSYLTRSQAQIPHPTLNKLLHSKSKVKTIQSLKQSKQVSLSPSKSKSRSQSKHKQPNLPSKPSYKLIQTTTVKKQSKTGKTTPTAIKRKNNTSASNTNLHGYSQKSFKATKERVDGIRTLGMTKPKNCVTVESCFKKKIRSSNKLLESKKQSLSKIVRQLFKSQQSSPIKPLPQPHPSPYHLKDQSLIYTAISTPTQSHNKLNVFNLQPQITPRMRCILIDWIITISSQLSLHRQATHLALSYLDIFISKKQLLKSQLQLCGIACLIIAVKQEQNENAQEVRELLDSCGEQGIWSHEDIFEMERTILFTLEFKLRMYTYSFWIDYLTERWDRFVAKRTNSLNLVRFRQDQEISTRTFQELTQLVDVSLHINDTIHHNKPKSILAVMYLLIRTHLQQQKHSPTPFKLKHMHALFQQKVTPLFNDKIKINQTFNEFMVESTGCELDTIFVEIKFMSQYLSFQCCYDSCEGEGKPGGSKKGYEKRLGLQTHSQGMLEYALKALK